jgi:nickel superoxide dismutase
MEDKMIYHFMKMLDKKCNFAQAKAHCDIPCGVYDPIIAQIDALTVVRMMDLMTGTVEDETKSKVDFQNAIARHIAVKEKHAEHAKQEVRIIFGDYIKAQHIEAHPELPGLFHKILQLGSLCRQGADRKVGLEFVDAINQFAEIFWKTKNIATKKAVAPYAPSLEMVYPVL